MHISNVCLVCWNKNKWNWLKIALDFSYCIRLAESFSLWENIVLNLFKFNLLFFKCRKQKERPKRHFSPQNPDERISTENFKSSLPTEAFGEEDPIHETERTSDGRRRKEDKRDKNRRSMEVNKRQSKIWHSSGSFDAVLSIFHGRHIWRIEHHRVYIRGWRRWC